MSYLTVEKHIILFSYMNNIHGNIDGCVEQYCCETALYLLSMLAHTYIIVIYRDVGSSGHGREVFDGLNTNYKPLLLMLMTTVQLHGTSDY